MATSDVLSPVVRSPVTRVTLQQGYLYPSNNHPYRRNNEQVWVSQYETSLFYLGQRRTKQTSDSKVFEFMV